MLLTCCFTRSAIKPKGGTDLVSLSGGALRALMSINCPFTLPTEIGFFLLMPPQARETKLGFWLNSG